MTSSMTSCVGGMCTRIARVACVGAWPVPARESEAMIPAAPGVRGGAWQLLWSRIFLGFVDLRP